MAKKKSSKNGNKHHSSSEKYEAKSEDNPISIVSIVSLVAALLILGVGLLRANHGNEANSNNSNPLSKQEAFLKWIVDNGGVFHPIHYGDKTMNVTLEKFPEFGGWGLALAVDSSQKEQCVLNSTAKAVPEEQCELMESNSTQLSEPVVQALDPLFSIPPALIITIPRILEMYSSSTSPNYIPTFYDRLHSILRQGLHGNGLSKQVEMMGLVEQDVILALYLMAEHCQHEHRQLFDEDSFYGPYLDVLPGLIPRLDTFEDEEYKVLNDQVLEGMGRESKRALTKMYNGGNGAKLKAVLLDMIATKHSSAKLEKASCTSFDSFHRFVALISSRAMVLRGEKRVVPLAEMINYAPGPKLSSSSIRPSFELFHTLEEDGSMTVRSDRDVHLSSDGRADLIKEDGSRVIQLFEDYGPVDSSLFLEAHGFVPDDNPNHCVVISGSIMISVLAPNGIEETDKQLILRALQILQLDPHVASPFLQDVCVRGDLTMVEDGHVIGRRPASDTIAVVALLGNKMSMDSDGELRAQCTSAVESNDAELIELRCARYPESSGVVRHTLRKAATLIVGVDSLLSSAEHGEEDDSEIKIFISNLQNSEAEGRDRMALAWRFRIAERRLLVSIASSTELSTEHYRVERAVETDLEKKINAFRSFIESLQLPVNKLEPRIVGNGMRVGTFARETIEKGDIYLSLTANSTIDFNTAIRDAYPDLKRLLQKYYKLDRDGFMALLIYLIHERFVMKEQSRWWPYLNLLPTVEAIKAFHPLFYSEEDINLHLAGSDVRKLVLWYQQKTAGKHSLLSSDVNASLVLGSERLLDKDIFLWACAVIDSRSIWWDGRRHLTPLLDLVNADSRGKPHETRSEASLAVGGGGTRQAFGAVTRASRHVQEGEQLFENYAQPNYLLFTYHGFVLEENNPDDCALMQVSIDRNDPGAKNVNLLPSTSSMFCIKDWTSIEELAHFLRLKYNLPLISDGHGEDVRPYLTQTLEQHISRLRKFAQTTGDLELATPYHIHCMRLLVKSDLRHFEEALKLVTDLA